MFSRKAFTLIELLVVIAILAILAVVVVLTLNPAELLRQARDSNRVSDMSTLTDALGIYTEDAGGSMGSSSVVYISIPDPSATSSLGDQCQGLGLPSLGGDTYHCAASSTFRNADGTGWIPINFQNISVGTPISSLPVDPTNTTSTGLYYTYMTNGTVGYQITYGTESQKYSQLCANESGQYSDLCEAGTSVGIAPIDFYSAGQPGKIYFNTAKNISASTSTIITLTFSGTASTSVSLALTGTNISGWCVNFGIKNPDGTTLGSQNDCGGSNSVNGLTLPTTGTYTVFLNAGSNTVTGTLTLTTSLGGAIAFNSPTSISTNAGQNIAYTFSGTASTTGISLALTGTNISGFCVSIGIKNPDGTTLGSQNDCGGSNSVNDLTLPTTGTYTVFLNPGAYAVTGTLTLTSPFLGTIAINGASTSVNTYYGQYVALTFSGTASTSVSLALTGTNISGYCTNFGVKNPNGTTLGSQNDCGGSNSINNIILPTTGTYTVFLNSMTGAVTGTFTLTSP